MVARQARLELADLSGLTASFFTFGEKILALTTDLTTKESTTALSKSGAKWFTSDASALDTVFKGLGYLEQVCSISF